VSAVEYLLRYMSLKEVGTY